jgi:hypothetical protein
MKQTIPSVLTDVLPMADVQKLTLKEACERFAARAAASQRAFAEMGKLHFALSAVLPKGRTIYGELRKLGVKDSTISNAAYASKVWAELIAPNALSEAVYDALTFDGCRDLCRLLGRSGSTKKKLEAADVAVIWQSAKDPEAEVKSLVETGLTVVEAAQDAADKAAKAAQDVKDAAKATPATPAAPVTPAGSPATPAPVAGTPAAAPASGSPAPAVSAPPAAKPVTAAKPTLAEVLAVLDSVELAIARLDPADSCRAAARVLELAKTCAAHAAKQPAPAQNAAAKPAPKPAPKGKPAKAVKA